MLCAGGHLQGSMYVCMYVCMFVEQTIRGCVRQGRTSTSQCMRKHSLKPTWGVQTDGDRIRAPASDRPHGASTRVGLDIIDEAASESAAAIAQGWGWSSLKNNQHSDKHNTRIKIQRAARSPRTDFAFRLSTVPRRGTRKCVARSGTHRCTQLTTSA